MEKKIYSYDEVTQIYTKHYNPSAVKATEPGFFKKWINFKYLGISVVMAVILSGIAIYLRKKYPKRLIRV